MLRVKYSSVIGDSSIDLVTALSGIASIPPQWKKNIEEGQRIAVDGRLKRNWRGIKKHVSRSPAIRGAATTIAVGAAGTAIALTGGAAALAIAPALVPLSALGVRLGLVAADRSAFNKLKFWQPTEIGSVSGSMKKYNDRQKRFFEQLTKADEVCNTTIAKDEIDGAVEQYFGHLGRGLHHLAKRNKEGDVIIDYVSNLFAMGDGAVDVKRAWEEDKEMCEDLILANFRAIFKKQRI